MSGGTARGSRAVDHAPCPRNPVAGWDVARRIKGDG